MAREDLIPVTKRTKEEAKRISRNGGIKSGQARREKKLLKDLLQTMLEMADTYGVDNQTKITAALLKKAKLGDTKAYEIIRDTLGQKPKEQLEVEANITYEEAIKKIAGKDEY